MTWHENNSDDDGDRGTVLILLFGAGTMWKLVVSMIFRGHTAFIRVDNYRQCASFHIVAAQKWDQHQ